MNDERQTTKDDSGRPPAHNGGDPHRGSGHGGLPDGWRPTTLPGDLKGPRHGIPEGGRGPSEKMVVPTFSGTMDAGDENLGQTARSYLRQIAAWRRMTRMAPEAQGLTLYQNLSGRAWVEAERLNVDELAEANGVDYLVSWVKDRYLDVEITQVGRCLSDFFRKLKRKPGQSVRDYLSDFDRCLARLNEVGCVLPDLAAAWVLVDRMGLEESAELNLLASVGNVYNLKMLQQASIVQDRTLRKPWETSISTRPWNKKMQSAMMADPFDGEETGDFGEDPTGEDGENQVVPEAVASELYEAYVTHETARQKYRDTLKLRGTDPEGMREAMHQKLQAAKQRSFCSACKRRGHWHKDPQCPLNQGKTAPSTQASSTGGTLGSGSGSSSSDKNAKVNYPCHVVHVTWDLAQPTAASSLLGITDTACSRSVAGVPWVESYLNSYLNEARKVGFRPPFLEAKESFKFGASRVFEALYSIVLTFDIGGHPIMVRISVVNGDVPLLLSRPVLGRLGMILDVNRNTADFRELRVQELQLVITDTGHPAVPVKPIFVDPALAQGGDWDGPEVKILSERVQYSVFALETVCLNGSDVSRKAPERNVIPSTLQLCPHPEDSQQITYNTPRSTQRPRNENVKDEPQIFYPKKLGSAVKGMLMADKLSPVPFMAWWNSTTTSNDFWIEGEQVLIRVHVIPRRTLFNPLKWNTSSADHKEALLQALGNLRSTEAISCKTHRDYHPVHGGWRDPEDDASLPLLWVGRSVFSRARMPSNRDPPKFENSHGFALRPVADRAYRDEEEDAVGVDQGRAHRRGSSEASPVSSEMDGRGDSPSDPRGPREGGRTICGWCATPGLKQDDPGPAQDCGDGGRADHAGSAEQGFSDEGPPRQRWYGGPDHPVFRPLQGVHVQGDCPQLPGLGDERDRGEPRSTGGLEDVRGVVPPGPRLQEGDGRTGDDGGICGPRGDGDGALHPGPARTMGCGGSEAFEFSSEGVSEGNHTASTERTKANYVSGILDQWHGSGGGSGCVGRDPAPRAPPSPSPRPPGTAPAPSVNLGTEHDPEELQEIYYDCVGERDKDTDFDDELPTKYVQDPAKTTIIGEARDLDVEVTGAEDDYEAISYGIQDGDGAFHVGSTEVTLREKGPQEVESRCENLARRLIHSRAFEVHDLLQLLEEIPLKVTKRQRGVNMGGDLEIKSFLGGMWTHGGLRGLSKQSQLFPWTVKYINKAMKKLSGETWGESSPLWTSFLLTQNVQTKVHKDVHNLSGSKVLTMSLGDFEGGRLWLEDFPPEPHGNATFIDEKGQALNGSFVDAKGKPFVFDPKRRHATGPWDGERWCISCFTTRGISDADQGERDRLRALCFPLRGVDKLIAMKPDDYIRAERPVKSVRKGMWKAAKRLVALTTVCSAAASSFTGEFLPLPRGKDAVALLEIGGWTKTLEASDYNFLTAEPILPEDLYQDDSLDKLNESIEIFAPGILWIHGEVVTGRLAEIGKIASNQVRKGRAVVWDAPEDASLWKSNEVERVCEEGGLFLERRHNGRKELQINVARTPDKFADKETVESLQSYLTTSTTTIPTSSLSHEVFAVTGTEVSSPDKREQEPRGASAITFSEGKKIPPEVQSALKRLHQNLAHPAPEDLGRHLRLAGGSPEVVEAAKRLRCQVCDRHHRGKSAKPSSMPALLEFNQLVAVDAFSVYDTNHVRVEFLLVIDIGTGFCIARQLEGHSGEALEKVFCDAWASTFGPPGSMILDLETGLQAGLARFSEWHGTWIRPIAAQAHYQQGSVERCIRSWKQIWEKVCDEKGVVATEAAMTATVINSAMNSLRRSSGLSPAQAVWGREPRLPEDLTLQAEAEHFESVLSRDRLRAREFALRTCARTAYYKCQSDATLRRALNHRTRVAGPELAVGDHVFIYRKPKSQKFWEWYGPGVLIGREGPNWWVSYSGRCHLTAPEHLRLASGEEIGAAFSLRATRDDLEKILEADFSDETLYVDDLQEAINVNAEDEVMIEGDDVQDTYAQASGENKRDGDRPKAPPVTKRQRKKGPGEDLELPEQEHSAHMTKFAKTARGREKALEKEIPWTLIPEEVQGLFKEAEAKQYLEHRQHEALVPLSVEESREVAKTKGDRILPSRFAYRDKHWSKRRQDPKAPWKPKARLVIGGHRDPDLTMGLNTHAPTISRQGILLLLQILASNIIHGWTGHAGDVTAAFLSGESLTRELFLRQPKTGLGNLHPEQLLRIRKPIFGLVDSPAAWWQKLSSTLKEMMIEDDDGKKWAVRQCELDNCIFTVHEVSEDADGKDIYGKPQAYLGIHVDDILLIGNDKLCGVLKRGLSKRFPIDEWETGSFDYVGSFIDIRDGCIKVSQESYVGTRLFTVDVEKGKKDWEPASETQRLDNMSLIGALSWLASQSRPDLQVGVSMSQQCQRDPCIGDIRFTNMLAQRALEHQQEGIYIYPVDFEKAVLLCYHDAGWANCPQDQIDPFYVLDDEEEKAGIIEGGPHGLLSRKAKKANSSIASQLGCFFVFGDRDVLSGERKKMSMLDWKSGACERVCRSTFQAETMACAYGIETSEYILKFLQTLLDGDLVRGPTKFPARFISDCKSLYDHLTREGIPRVPTCKRLAIDLASIRCDLRRFGKIAWTPTRSQMADLLTKPLKSGSWWEEMKRGIKLTFREEKILNQCKSRIEFV